MSSGFQAGLVEDLDVPFGHAADLVADAGRRGGSRGRGAGKRGKINRLISSAIKRAIRATATTTRRSSPGRRRRRRADRGAAFHAALLDALDAARGRAGDADAPCRRRHLPAGQGGRPGTAQDACRMGQIDEAAAEHQRGAGAGRRIIACGTTSVRLLESAAGEDGRLRPSRARPACSSRPAIGFARSIASSPIFTCRARPCSCWSHRSRGWSRCGPPTRMRWRGAIAFFPMAMPVFLDPGRHDRLHPPGAVAARRGAGGSRRRTARSTRPLSCRSGRPRR